MSFPYLTISSNLDTLNSGSMYSSADLDIFGSGSYSELYFGNSEQDIIEFSVFDINGNQNAWKILDRAKNYSIINKKYVDVYGKPEEYTYKRFNSGYISSFDKTLLLDILTDLKDVNIESGNHVVSYNFLKNVAGDSKNKLYVQNISSDRKELKLVPSFSDNVSDEYAHSIWQQFKAFSTKSILLNDVIDIINRELDSFQIFSNSTGIIQENTELFSTIKNTFGFIYDADVIKFLDETYNGYTKINYDSSNALVQSSISIFNGIKNYIKDWEYLNYKEFYTTSELISEIKNIVTLSISNRLVEFKNFYNSKSEVEEILKEEITNLFYDKFIYEILNKVIVYYNEKFYAYLKNSLNFSNNYFLPIIDFIGGNENGKSYITVKLFSDIPDTVSIRSDCYISNISISPLIEKIVIDSPVISKKNKISGPNFNVNSKKTIDYKNSSDLKLSSEDGNNVEVFKKLNQTNIDYTNFSDFIIFSSAEIRTKLYINKYYKITQLSSSISNLSSNIITSSFALSASYVKELDSCTTTLKSIYSSFDGYDAYLYSNRSLLSGSSVVSDYLAKAVEYDKNNPDSLINNTPSYIIEDSENEDYLMFLSMIGHHFDNIYSYIKNFPTNQYVKNNESSSYISQISNIILNQFGWDAISSFDTKKVEYTYLSSSQNNNSNRYSDDEKTKTIWNRILNNLPILYKTKGTEECIRLISNIYGIPHNLLNVKEFGGNNLSDEDKSSYEFTYKYYLTQFKRKNEFIKLPYSNVKSIEFKLRFDPSVIYENNAIIPIAYRDNNLKVYVKKSIKNLLGTVIFKLNDIEISSDSLPLFNGKIYNILIKEQNTDDMFDVNTLGYFPNYYTLKVNSYDGGDQLFDSENTLLLDYSYHTVFSSTGSLVFGNSGSYNSFYGNIDKINLWNTTLNNNSFIEHCKNYDSYGDNDGENTYSNLNFRYSFEYPINLAISSSVNIRNGNRYYSTTGSINNFHNTDIITVDCIEQSSSVYPYQFYELDITQNSNISNFGPNKLKNSKINRSTETIVSRLMPTERSTVSNTITTDSNIIGVYISPFKVRDDDILNFLGDYNIMNDIGDPENIYKSKYDGLETLRNYYNTNNLSEKILYQEFLTLYKHYFDGSFFETVRKMLPARTKVIDGIIIEPSLLERPKYKNRQVQAELSNNLDGNINTIYSSSGRFLPMYTSSYNVKVNKSDNVSTIYPMNFSNVLVDGYNERYNVFSIGGTYYQSDLNNMQSVYVYSYNNVEQVYGRDIKNSDVIPYEKYKKLYNLMPSGSGYSSFAVNTYYAIDIESYPVGHKSLKRNPNKVNKVNQLSDKSVTFTTFKKSRQNTLTTVNANGISDGSSPVEITAINKQLSEISLISD